jgi:hypothetical protein
VKARATDLRLARRAVVQRPSRPAETSAVGPVVTSVVGTSIAGSSVEGCRIVAAMAEAWPTSEAEAAGGIEAGEIGVAAATAAAAAADKSQSTGWAHPPKLVCKKGRRVN